MSDSNDTIRSPDDPSVKLAHQVAELNLALMRVGEVTSRIQLTLSQIQLAEVTLEHRHNVQRERMIAGGRMLIDQERRLREVESELGLTGTDAE